MAAGQRYRSPTALARMADGKCPECGEPGDEHTGSGSARCTLTDNGVAQRVGQYRQDQRVAQCQQDLAGP